jgi:hypothetical protein
MAALAEGGLWPTLGRDRLLCRDRSGGGTAWYIVEATTGTA